MPKRAPETGVPNTAANPAPMASNPTEARWLGLAASVATLVWVLAMVEIFSYRAHQDYLSVVSEPIEKFKAAVAPIPEQIRNVLMTRSRDHETVRLTSSETISGTGVERSYAAKPSMPRKELAEKTVKSTTKAAETATQKSLDGAVTVPAVQPSGNNSGSRRNGESRQNRYQVVGNSFVREEPTAGSEIIATLRPGTQIQLMGKRGEYFRIGASFNGETIRGYVHEEDAFFEPIN